jgi:hypothetical protein
MQALRALESSRYKLVTVNLPTYAGMVKWKHTRLITSYALVRFQLPVLARKSYAR